MFKPIESILLATNLSENCRDAFEMAAALATRHQATLVLLHVIEPIPNYVESRLKGLLGEKQFGDIAQTKANKARSALIGKQSSNTMIKSALAQFCTASGIDDNACDYQSREIVVTDGDLVDEIIAQAEAHQCNLIVMGARENFLKDNSIGQTIKSVMRRSKVSVMMVPSKMTENR